MEGRGSRVRGGEGSALDLYHLFVGVHQPRRRTPARAVEFEAFKLKTENVYSLRLEWVWFDPI
ncbi:hypothetical protein D8674_038041 [Pyrus ussuriensis x Pyrus communis]|uniref:Uncharacterized protein n=1 Tax=Pyrus ussuriensis x Pyrus communis TaxID=2448454 RepID=A0A5N5I6R2_9ROSA|nr:hypothetical protein D8674_038041 [Pyrus ussuriensis x Pyrus communis]